MLSLFSKGKDILSSNLGSVQSQVQSSIQDNIKGQLGQVQDKMQSTLQSGVGMVNDKVGQVQDRVGQLQNQVQSQVQDRVGHVQNQVQSQVQDRVGQVQNQVQSQVQDRVGEVQSQVQDRVGHVQNQVQSQVQDRVGQVQNQVQSQVQDRVGHVQNQVQSQVQDRFGQVQNQVQSQVKDRVGQVQNQVQSQVQDRVGQVQSQVQDRVGQAQNQIQERVQNQVGLSNGQIGLMQSHVQDKFQNRVGLMQGKAGHVQGMVPNDVGQIHGQIQNRMQNNNGQVQNKTGQINGKVMRVKGHLQSGSQSQVVQAGEQVGKIRGHAQANPNNRMGQLQGHVGQANGQIQSQVGQMQGQIQGKVGQMQGQVQGQVEQMQGQIQGQVGQMQGQVGQMQGQVGQMQGQVGQVQGQVGQMQGHIQGKVGQMQGQIQGQVGQMQGQVQGQVGQMQGQIQGKVGQMQGQIQGQVGQIQSQVQNKIGQIKNLPGQMQAQVQGQIGHTKDLVRGKFVGGIGQLRGFIPGQKGDVPDSVAQESQTPAKVSNGNTTSGDATSNTTGPKVGAFAVMPSVPGMGNQFYDNLGANFSPDKFIAKGRDGANAVGNPFGMFGNANTSPPSGQPASGEHVASTKNTEGTNSIPSPASMVTSSPISKFQNGNNDKSGNNMLKSFGAGERSDGQKGEGNNSTASDQITGVVGMFAGNKTSKRKRAGKYRQRSLIGEDGEIHVTYEDTKGPSCVYTYGAIVRLILVCTNVLVAIRTVTATDIHWNWGAAPVCGMMMALEFALIVFKRDGLEWTWWLPCLGIFLITTLPMVWQLQISGIFADGAVSKNTDIWTIVASDAVVYLTIIARWFLQGGQVTILSLATIIMEFLANASDIMDLLSMTDNPVVRSSMGLMFWVLIAWSLSFIKFIPLFDDVIENDNDEDESDDGDRQKKTLPLWIQDRFGYKFPEVVQIVISLVLLDGSFLALRLYLVIVEGVVTFGLVFFIIKNLLSFLMQGYKLVALCRTLPCMQKDEMSRLSSSSTTCSTS